MLLQYKQDSDDVVFYNIRTDDGYATVMHNIVNGEKCCSNMAAATISPNGRYGLAINFECICDLRKVYGYFGFEDKFKNECRPKDDGMFLIDFLKGTTKLFISSVENV